VRRKGELVALAMKEFKTLVFMIENAGRVISRDELLNIVWGYECYPSTRTVDNHIRKLRQKLETEPSRPQALSDCPQCRVQVLTLNEVLNEWRRL